MKIQQFSMFAGDAVQVPVVMTWGGEPFDPAGEWELMASAKEKVGLVDQMAQWQKTSLAGISHVGQMATIDLVNQDTRGMTTKPLVCDIRARHLITGERRTVARFDIAVTKPPTLEEEPVQDIHTTNPPVRGDAIVYNRVDGTFHRVFIGAAEDGALTIMTELFSLAPVDTVAPVVIKREDNSRWLLFIGDDGEGGATLQAEPIP